jgi:hypothetical protein
MAIDLRRETPNVAKHIIDSINSMANIKKEEVNLQKSMMLDKIERERGLKDYKAKKDIDLDYQNKETQGLVGMLNPETSAPIQTPTEQNQLPAMSLPSGEVGDVTGQQTSPQEQQAPQSLVIDGITYPTAKELLYSIRASGDTVKIPQLQIYDQIYKKFARGEGSEGEKKMMNEFLGIKGVSGTETLAKKKFIVQQEEKVKKQKEQSQMVKSAAEDMLNTVDYLSDDTNIKEFGFSGPMYAVPGTRKREWVAELNYLKGKQVLNLMTQLRQASHTGATGFGQLSEKELALLQGSANKLERGLSESAAKKELERIRSTLVKIIHGDNQGKEETTEEQIGAETPQGDSFSYLWQ